MLNISYSYLQYWMSYEHHMKEHKSLSHSLSQLGKLLHILKFQKHQNLLMEQRNKRDNL